MGGYSDDYGYSLAVDLDGNIYVTGSTYSNDYPTTEGAYRTTYIGSGDIFVSKFSNDLKTLIASTFLGGTLSDESNCIVLDTEQNIILTGTTISSNFPATSGVYDASYNGGGDVFVSKLNSSLTSLIASTYLGGSSGDGGYSLNIDSDGNVYVTGRSRSSNFPTTKGAYDTSFNKVSYGHGFVSKLNSSLTGLLASTFLGGTNDINDDILYSIFVESDGNVYVAGYTYSSDYPTTNGVFAVSYSGNCDGVISKLTGDLSGSVGTVTPSPSPSPTHEVTPAPTLQPFPTVLPTLSPLPTVISTQTPIPGGSGIIYGFVYDANEEALKGVTVKITGDNFSDSVTTDEDGYYEFSGLNGGECTLTYEKEDYQRYTEDITLGDGEEMDMGTIIMEIIEKGMIYGYVVNIKGNSIEYVRLKLKGINTKTTKQTSSDADGYFEFADLEADTYIITAKKKGFKPVNRRLKLGDEEVTDIEIMMKKSSKRITFVND